MKRHLYHACLWLVALVFFAPILWIFLSSFKTVRGILATPPQFLFTPTLSNYVDLFERPNVLPYLMNSILISTTALVIAIVVSFLAAYSFSRFQPKGTDLAMFLLLSVRMVPAAAVIIPVYLMYVAFGWKGSWWGVVMFYAMFSIPFSVWDTEGLHRWRIHAFRRDGAGQRWGSAGIPCFALILPQVRPGLIAAFIFNLIFVWNEFLFNFIVSGPRSTTIPALLATNLYANAGVDWTFMATLTSGVHAAADRPDSAVPEVSAGGHDVRYPCAGRCDAQGYVRHAHAGDPRGRHAAELRADDTAARHLHRCRRHRDRCGPRALPERGSCS